MKQIKMGKSIQEVVKENPEGFSISLDGMELKQYKEGYAVSITDIRTDLNNLDQDFKKVCMILNSLNIPFESKVIGGWTYQGVIYLDATIYLKNKKTALLLGQVFRQLAIYDFKNKKSIEVKKEWVL